MIRSRALVIGMAMVSSALVQGARAETIGISDGKPKVDSAPVIPSGPCATADEIAKKAQPYRDLIRSFWVKDSLFMYAELSKVISSQLDTALDGNLRKKIASFKTGTPGVTAEELETALSSVLDNTSAYADSMVNKFNHPFYWHNPVFKVKAGDPRSVSVTIPTTISQYSLTMELGNDKSAEEAQIKTKVREIIDERVARALQRDQRRTAEVYHSEKEYLVRHEHIDERCLGVSDSSRSNNLTLPADTGKAVSGNITSRGRKDGSPVMGFPISGHVGSPSAVDSPYGDWNGKNMTYDSYYPYQGGNSGGFVGGAGQAF